MDQELKDGLDKIDQRFTALRNLFDQRMDEMEKSLIRAFRQLLLPISSRIDSAEVLVQGFNARLALIEKRLTDLELPEE